MGFSKASWQFRGLGLPSGVGLTRPIRRAAVAQTNSTMLLVGDGLATSLAPALKRVVEEANTKLLGPVISRPVGMQPVSSVVFAFGAVPTGAPEGAWQLPILAIYRDLGSRLLWLDVGADSLLDSPSLRSAAATLGAEVVRPSEKVLRRAPNGAISAVGIAGLAGIVGAWARHSTLSTRGKTK